LAAYRQLLAGGLVTEQPTHMGAAGYRLSVYRLAHWEDE
jgi:hypothetical protein